MNVVAFSSVLAFISLMNWVEELAVTKNNISLSLIDEQRQGIFLILTYIDIHIFHSGVQYHDKTILIVPKEHCRLKQNSFVCVHGYRLNCKKGEAC